MRSTDCSITTMASLKIAVSHIVLCTLFGLTGIDGKPPTEIVGGAAAADGEFPYQISLGMYGSHICGGSIIDSTHILTAAHCLENPQTAIWYSTVTAGTNNLGAGRGQTYRIKSIKIHPQYSPTEADSWKNDIAVITLASAIRFDSRQKAVKLPTRDTPAGTEAVASGWGDTSYPRGITPVGLRKVTMRVLANNRCNVPGTGYIHSTHLCAFSRRGSGVCSGDSGGPLVSDGTIVGVASFVIPCGVGYPDVFTRVYSYVNWIKSVTANS